MRPIKISRRPRWRQHIQENAYQADVLSDPSEEYWVEAKRSSNPLLYNSALQKLLPLPKPPKQCGKCVWTF